MPHLLVLGPGYTASRIADRARADGWQVSTAGRATMADAGALIPVATHILSSVPPDGIADPVLALHAAAIRECGACWIGYLSSTGVYGDRGGAWIDEAASVTGRRTDRNSADLAWAAIHPEARVFRLPGIYGPGRSALDRLREGKAHRIALPGQVFSRIHVDDIVSGVIASIARGPAGIYNLADDLPAPQNDVVAYGAMLLGLPAPPVQSLEEARLSPMARAFYAENRRVSNLKARRLLDWAPTYRTYREGLTALL